MIVDLPDTTTSQVSKEIMTMREDGGVVALGRVLTLVVITHSGHEEEAIDAANAASREHPCRIIVLAGDPEGETKLDAEIRVGGDAGASEVVILRGSGSLAAESESMVSALLLPDAPIVAWWPHGVPESAASSSIGRIAHRRITDSANEPDPRAALEHISRTYVAGDTDLAWTRLTNWRIQLAAVMDQVPAGPVNKIVVEGATDSPSTLLLAAWLGLGIEAPIEILDDPAGTGMRRVLLERADGNVELVRPDLNIATLSQPGQPNQRIALPRRSLQACLAEELRRLDPDEIFGEVITTGLRHATAGAATNGSSSAAEETASP